MGKKKKMMREVESTDGLDHAAEPVNPVDRLPPPSPTFDVETSAKGDGDSKGATTKLTKKDAKKKKKKGKTDRQAEKEFDDDFDNPLFLDVSPASTGTTKQGHDVEKGSTEVSEEYSNPLGAGTESAS